MLAIAVNNISKKEEIDFRAKVLQTMILQIRKKLNNESKFSSSQLPKANKAIRTSNGDALLYLETDPQSNSTLRTFSSDK